MAVFLVIFHSPYHITESSETPMESVSMIICRQSVLHTIKLEACSPNPVSNTPNYSTKIGCVILVVINRIKSKNYISQFSYPNREDDRDNSCSIVCDLHREAASLDLIYTHFFTCIT
nr:hypothetical protein Iba_chr01aCG19710 [Ipomoea batatas]